MSINEVDFAVRFVRARAIDELWRGILAVMPKPAVDGHVGDQHHS